MKKAYLFALLMALVGTTATAQTLLSPPSAATGYCYYAAGNEYLPIATTGGGSVVLNSPPPAFLVYGNYAAGPNYQPLQCDSSGNLIVNGGGGGVSSVGLSMPAIFSVANSPITGSGTFVVTLGNQTANYFWAGPATGSAAAPTFRALVNADIPTTLTGITIDGVSPTTMGYVDPTSSIQTQLNAKAPLASPALTGNPTAPTQSCASNTDIATGAYVANCAGSSTLPSGVNGQTLTNTGGGATTYSAQSPSISLMNGGSAITPPYSVLCDSATVATGIQDRGKIGDVTATGTVTLPDLSGTGCNGMYGQIENGYTAAITVSRQTSDTLNCWTPGSAPSTGQTTCSVPAGSWAFFSPASTTAYDVKIAPVAYTLPSQYKTWSCQTGLGDGLNAIPAGTYLQTFCKNTTGVTVTLTGLQCYTDNSGSSTMNAAGNTLGALLTGAVTCSSSYAAGTQSANVALTNGDYIKFTFVADGTSKQATFVVTGTY